MKEYWEQAERLRRRINRKIHEIHLLRQRAEGMNGSGINDMPRTVSPDRSKMEGTVFKIMALEQDIQDTQAEYDALLTDMEARIKTVEDGDANDLLRKRYLEFLPWSLELYQQTNARLWRQGQRAESVVIIHLTAVGTIDENIMMALECKDKTQAAMMRAVKARIK